jgi:hypothetical protein
LIQLCWNIAFLRQLVKAGKYKTGTLDKNEFELFRPVLEEYEKIAKTLVTEIFPKNSTMTFDRFEKIVNCVNEIAEKTLADPHQLPFEDCKPLGKIGLPLSIALLCVVSGLVVGTMIGFIFGPLGLAIGGGTGLVIGILIGLALAGAMMWNTSATEQATKEASQLKEVYDYQGIKSLKNLFFTANNKINANRTSSEPSSNKSNNDCDTDGIFCLITCCFLGCEIANVASNI